MAKICDEENCGYQVWGGGKCKFHQYLRRDKKPKKPNPFSEKLLNNLKIYKVVRPEYLSAHPVCQAKIDGCTGESTQIHHKAGRIGDLLINKKYFLAVCFSCHQYIENHPEEAKQKGWSISRFIK